ncbi:MAG: pyridoxal phosphate-dependent aminotransferase [Lutibacter sp.]|uniref:pyridoxal phosphate-dependent aminotransferase n=1 Tax=Lutibacter sp. TaxID=1925666 RepID=UPI00299ED3A0|nr:pyridoxal phosphate-dependent aminotransferase [Lutibacter sp.]MDX1830435.1 pyridoxal phosphate-dependent aminotransferase [Lutibacter sp.]
MELAKTQNTPIDFKTVKSKIEKSGIKNIGTASIRELVSLVNEIQKATGEKFIRMEMGVPGLTPPEIGMNAEIKALKAGVAAQYPMIDGVSHLKDEITLFVKNFLNINVDRKGCIPTVGSMQGAFATFLMANKLDSKKDTVLFIDPGFPVQKQQLKILNQKYETFDVYNYRGKALEEKLISYLEKGNINSIIYSNPNNPSWICFSEKELEIIGKLATKYDAIVVEDLAYFAMDFRKDYSKPGQAPYQPTVANYTDNWILLISSSKSFSNAGQRIGMMVISNVLFNRKYNALNEELGNPLFGYNLIYKVLYSLSSGVTHSAQYGLAAMLKAANSGEFDFVELIKEYGRRAKIMKKLFLDNGFTIVYDKDEDKILADGFYFTFSYKNMSGSELLERLLYYGISAISLEITGSYHIEGLRACVSQTKPTQFKNLEYRLQQFNKDFS